MYRRTGSGNVGVLIDYDLSGFRDQQTPTSKSRTGTQPFMAFELLANNPPIHRLRHDLESMFYVLCWITHHYEDGFELTSGPFRKWQDLSAENLIPVKDSFIGGAASTALTRNFSSLQETLSRLHLLFRTAHRQRIDAIDQRRLHTFDDETSGGTITGPIFLNIFEQYIQLQTQ